MQTNVLVKNILMPVIYRKSYRKNIVFGTQGQNYRGFLYLLCSRMVKGAHLWVSMKTSKRDWKPAGLL